MFNAKNLTSEQVATLQQWAADGAQLNDIQKKMEDEMEHKLTYMDVRFLVLDLEITIRDIQAEEAALKAAQAEEIEEATELDALAEEMSAGDADHAAGVADMADPMNGMPPEMNAAPAVANSSVTVTLDAIAKPGLMATGRVTFSDGEAGDWYIDDRGLGINPDNIDHVPEPSEIEAFQRELQRLMESQ